MPLCQAAATARRSSVLRDEHRMSSKRRLLSVIDRLCRSEAPRDEIPCVIENHGHSLRLQVLSLLDPKSKSSAKRRLGQRPEQIVQITQMAARAMGCRSSEP